MMTMTMYDDDDDDDDVHRYLNVTRRLVKKMQGFKVTDSKHPSLTESETSMAVKDLYVSDYVNPYKYPRVNRKFVDPINSSDPRFALFSFIKAPESEHDIYGVAKIRGVFYTQQEADDRAEEIVRNVDSCNSIFTCIVGVPFPLVCHGYSHSTSEIDLKEKVETTISENVRRKRNEEQKEITAINEREKRLVEDVHPEKVKNDEDAYIEQRVKLAHLKYAIDEHEKKMNECSALKSKVTKFLIDESIVHPDFEQTYLKKYMSARREANIPEDTDMSGFMRYMADPLVNRDDDADGSSVVVV